MGAANPTLLFHLECQIAVGAADCQGRRKRRQVNNLQNETVSFDFVVNAENAALDELDGGIVVALENAESTGVTAAATFAGILLSTL